MATTLDRRAFLKATVAAGGGLVVGGYLSDLVGAPATVKADGVFEPNVWVKISADDTVTMTLTMLEMGQGVMTSMPMLVAEELDIDWNRIKTGLGAGRCEVRQPRIRRPAADRRQQQRARHVEAAARIRRDGARDARHCGGANAGRVRSQPTTDRGEVVHEASGRRLKYGALVDKAAALPVPTNVTLKAPKDFKVLGQSMPRLDIPEKVNGTAEFGLDVKRPGMLIARIVKCPVFGGTAAGFNADKAKAVPGVKHVVRISSGIAVVADTYWAASKGVQALDVKWDEGTLATLNSADIMKHYAQLAEQPGKVARDDGDTARR